MKNFLWDRKKWSPLIIYSILALVSWVKRATLIYTHLPIWFSTVLYDLMLVSLLFSGFACIFHEIRCPFLTKAKVNHAFKQSGVMNKLGQYPTLIAVTEDLNKKHGKRYTINNVGVTVSDMESKRDSLQQVLGVIYRISETPKPGYTYLYVLPGKSLLPAIIPIVYDNDF